MSRPGAPADRLTRVADRPSGRRGVALTVGDMTTIHPRCAARLGAVAVVVLALAAIVLTDAVVHHGALAGLDGRLAGLGDRAPRGRGDAGDGGREPVRQHAVVGRHRAGGRRVAGVAGQAGRLVAGRRGSAGAIALGPLLKELVERPRPELAEHVVFVNSWAYPSGHSLNSLAVLGLLTVLAVRERPGGWRGALLVAVGVVLVVDGRVQPGLPGRALAVRRARRLADRPAVAHDVLHDRRISRAGIAVRRVPFEE